MAIDTKQLRREADQTLEELHGNRAAIMHAAADEIDALRARSTIVTQEQVERMARHAWQPAGDVPRRYVEQVADMLRAAGIEVAS